MKYSALVIILISSIISNKIMAATYYVKPDGNDSADGISHATAWKTLSRAKSLQTGDDVYFLAGGVWKNQWLNVNWSGSTENHTIVGSYYMNNGSETIGVPAGTSKPTFVGAYPIVGGTTGAIPPGAYKGLVDVGVSHVTVQNIRVEKSSGGAMLATGKSGEEITDIIFENNEAIDPAGNLIQAKRYTSNVVIRNNVMRGCAQAYTDSQWVGPNHPVCSGFVGSFDGLMENNFVYEGDGEAIVSFSGGGNNIIRGNTVASNRFLAIYIDGSSNNLVENNIVIGNPGDNDKKNGYSSGAININVEYHGGSEKNATGNVIRNNLIANVYNCFGANIQPGSIAAGKKIGFQIIGNTCIATKHAIGVNASGSDNIEPSSVIANNIFYDVDDGPDQCDIRGSSPNFIFKNNLWGKKPAETTCNGNGDIYGDPLLRKTTDWRLTGPLNIPSPADFTPEKNSLVYGAGASLANLIADYNGNIRSAPPAVGAIDSTTITQTGVSIPYYMNIGGGELNLGKVYLAEDYETSTGSNKGSSSVAVGGTNNDAVYQTWRGKNGTLSWSIPIVNGNYDVTLLYQEQYWGVAEGDCTVAGSNRQFDVSVEGILVRNEFDICALAGASNTATRDVIRNVNVVDGQLDIELSLGQGEDPKPQLMGLELTIADPAPSAPSNFTVK